MLKINIEVDFQAFLEEFFHFSTNSYFQKKLNRYDVNWISGHVTENIASSETIDTADDFDCLVSLDTLKCSYLRSRVKLFVIWGN